MSGYGKKDEDADGAIVRVDRTAVFQEGRHRFSGPRIESLTPISTSLQFVSNLTTKMSNPPYEDRPSPFYWGKVPIN
jgi:hypothetical protein